MTLLDLVILALRTLTKNKLRSGLTVLGVVIGIAAVTTMVSLGEGGTQLIQNQFQGLGSNVLIVLPGRQHPRGRAGGPGAKLHPGDRDPHAVGAPPAKA